MGKYCAKISFFTFSLSLSSLPVKCFNALLKYTLQFNKILILSVKNRESDDQ